jgi:hypothetical protein
MTKSDENNLLRMNGMMKTARTMSMMMTIMELMMLAMMNPMVRIIMNVYIGKVNNDVKNS